MKIIEILEVEKANVESPSFYFNAIIQIASKEYQLEASGDIVIKEYSDSGDYDTPPHSEVEIDDINIDEVEIYNKNGSKSVLLDLNNKPLTEKKVMELITLNCIDQ